MTIFWTRKSKLRFLEIEDYLRAEFGELTAQNFKTKVLGFLRLLEKFPKMGSLEFPEKQIYGFQITKQTRLFYRISNGRISLLTFFDSRQDPGRKPQ